jgi:protein-S-isoprenylcysteine O-methyltransferase Ste14
MMLDSILMLDPVSISGALWLGWGLYWIVAAMRVKKDARSEAPLERFGHLALLGLAFALALGRVPLPVELASILPEPARWIGCLITALGLGFAVWARLHLGAYWSGKITIKAGHELIRTGPYAFVRHPIYTGFVSGFLGLAVSGGRPEGLIGLLLVIVAYAIKIRREERVLGDQFAEYADYKKSVRALIPFVF